MTKSAVLFGDSIIDNAPYVGPTGRDVTSHLKEFAPDWAVERRALDGAVCDDVVRSQLIEAIPENSHLILSVGGNDALQNSHLLSDPTPMTFGSAMGRFREIREEFRTPYREALSHLLKLDGPVLVLTIYNPRFGLDDYPEGVQIAAEGALSAFNDVIQQEAIHHRFDVLDIREVCVSDEDYANPIEPSDSGGRKIARRIANWLEASSIRQENKDA